MDRFHHAFWSHPHYRGKYGETAEGFLKYAKESVRIHHVCLYLQQGPLPIHGKTDGFLCHYCCRGNIGKDPVPPSPETIASVHLVQLAMLRNSSFLFLQVEEFEACEDSYGPVRCVLYFEALGQRQEDVFFHCDQVRPRPGNFPRV